MLLKSGLELTVHDETVKIRDIIELWGWLNSICYPSQLVWLEKVSEVQFKDVNDNVPAEGSQSHVTCSKMFRLKSAFVW